MKFRGIQWFVILSIIMFLFVVPIALERFITEKNAIYITQGTLFILGSLYVLKHRRNIFHHTRLRLPPWWSFLIVIPLVLANLFLASFLTSISVMITRSLGWADIPLPDLTAQSTNNLVLIATFSILPGIVEEFYCRGVLLHSYQTTVSTKTALFWSAFVFSLLHFNVWNFLSPIMGGIIFGLLTIRFDSILPAMFGHSLFNLAAIVSQKLQKAEDITPLSEIGWDSVIQMLPLATVSFLVVVFIFKKLNVSERFQPAKVKLRWFDHIPSGIILLIFIGLSFMVQAALAL